MRSWIMGLALGLAITAGAAHANVRPCTEKEYDAASTVGWDQDGHALFEIPPITYNRPKTEGLGLQLIFVVAKDGHIVCLDRGELMLKVLGETPERRALIPRMEEWRFKPFLDKDKPVQSVVRVFVDEKVDFQFHEDMPAAPASDMTITLSRSACYGTCPSYSVTLHGNGWVEYNGSWYTAVRGRHVYTVDPARIAGLMADMKTNDVWSMSGNWVTEGYDAPRYSMDVTIGGERRHFEDYFGRFLGIPPALTDFMNEVDVVSRTDDFIHLSAFAVRHLENEGFNFRSQQAADLFFAAVNDEATDDAVLLRLIELGVPVLAGHADKESYKWSSDPPLVAALRNRHAGLIEPLISMGALNTAGKPDQAKIDAAFQAAIAGGRLAAVQRLWQQAGTRPHPSLVFSGEDFQGNIKKRLPVILLLKRDEDDPDWQGLEIARWLIAQGCDIHARDVDGRTVLDIALDADDEDLAMLLIEAGADPWKLETDPDRFRKYVTDAEWTHVLAWMDAHKPQGQGTSPPKP